MGKDDIERIDEYLYSTMARVTPLAIFRHKNLLKPSHRNHIFLHLHTRYIHIFFIFIGLYKYIRKWTIRAARLNEIFQRVLPRIALDRRSRLPSCTCNDPFIMDILETLDDNTSIASNFYPPFVIHTRTSYSYFARSNTRQTASFRNNFYQKSFKNCFAAELKIFCESR